MKNVSVNHNPSLSAESSISHLNENIYSTNHALNVNANISVTGVVTSDNQTNGDQKTQIVDAGGEVATVTGGKLDVNATASLAGTTLPISGATEAVGVAIVDDSGNQITSFGGGVQYTDGDNDPTPTGNVVMWLNSGNGDVLAAADNAPLPVTNPAADVILNAIDSSNTAIAADTATLVATQQTDALTDTQLRAAPVVVDLGVNNDVTVTGTVTASAGTDLNTSALALESGGNLATIAGKDFATQTTLAAINAKLVSGTDIGDVTINNASGASAVNIQDGGNSITVDNGGTFAVQATLAAETTKVIGTVNQGTSPWVTSNATTSVVGNGASATAQRVTLANDSTGIIATVGAVTAITNALPAGTNAIGKLAANSGVDIGDVDITSVLPGTGATNLGKAEDAAHTTGDVGVMDLGVRNDTLADQTSTNGDYGSKSVDIKGRVMTAGAPRALKANAQVSLSNTTTETTIISATASTFHDVYGLILANTGATTTKVSIRDDTAGTVRAVIEVPTLETRGFMLPVDSAMTQTAVNKNWTAQCASATTALEVTALYVSMV